MNDLIKDTRFETRNERPALPACGAKNYETAALRHVRMQE